ncbi:NAD(P)/FAD-dependent oxidoreductase [Salipaludibacillus daqingensis]|uniref:NAD(P)/FAD-dependent oxidoreductase n=1 Tax=Salipaludibacillus daqingensis TaxID=3041001 RepID=UPI002474DC27|nr:FAD-dependent oxidoreductase [Salipaludibacillus daqingensis]
MNISIIGGGLCGIFAAKTLRDYGHNPIIYEKSRSIGGRMATRRIGKGKADHGAQFFTVRSKELQGFTEEWLAKGWIKHWFGDDYPRYASVDGMNPFVKKLAHDLSVQLNERIVSIEENSSTLTLNSDVSSPFSTDVALITAPVPQALKLLQAPSMLNKKEEEQLSSSQFNPAFVGLVSLKKPVQIGNKGIRAESLPHGVDKVISNDEKGISETSILSIYMTGEWSYNRFGNQDTAVLKELVESIYPHIFSTDNIDDIQLKRWRYAEATHVYRQPFLKLDNKPVYIAGDSFLSPEDKSGRTRIESAIISGIRVGEAIHIG